MGVDPNVSALADQLDPVGRFFRLEFDDAAPLACLKQVVGGDIDVRVLAGDGDRERTKKRRLPYSVAAQQDCAALVKGNLKLGKRTDVLNPNPRDSEICGLEVREWMRPTRKPRAQFTDGLTQM